MQPVAVRRKIFLAGPFKGILDPATGQIRAREREIFESLIALLERKGFQVHNAHLREGWGQRFMSPEECTAIDYDEIRRCDDLIALPGDPASPGTHVELGWASALGKRVVLLCERDAQYAFLVRGLHRVTEVHTITYGTLAELLAGIEALYDGAGRG